MLHICAMSYTYRKFQPASDTLKPFDCGDADLNGFLVETSSTTPNATMYEKQRLAVTYVVEDNDTHSILAYFSILHDKIERDFADSRVWNRLSRSIPNAKRRSSYPAVKVGRLAVCNEAQGTGLGREILAFVKAWYYNNPRAGCRFITVDALRSAEDFYGKCRFRTLAEAKPDDETVLMYYDMMGIV